MQQLDLLRRLITKEEDVTHDGEFEMAGEDGGLQNNAVIRTRGLKSWLDTQSTVGVLGR